MPASEAPAPFPTASTTDFADRWPPMAVKELRQGLRSRGFLFPFLALHLLILAAVAIEFLLTRAGGTPTDWQRALSTAPGFSWIVVHVVVAGLMPLRLMDSLRSETDGGNTELLLLGGLSRWQIVRGKWLVQATLTLLTLVSLLPYMLVRYFFGGIELLPNLFTFFSVLAASLGMSGCVIGASGYSNLGFKFFLISAAGLILIINTCFIEAMINSAQGTAVAVDLFLFAYIYAYGLLLHLFYAIIGLQLGRAHLKLYLLPYEIPPTRNLVAMLLTAPFMLIAGAVATCGWGAIIVLVLLAYAVSNYDKPQTPP